MNTLLDMINIKTRDEKKQFVNHKLINKKGKMESVGSKINTELLTKANDYFFDICIYHKDCNDGIASFWCVKKWGQNYDIVGIPMNHHDKLDKELLANKNIILVDICFSKEKMIILESLCQYTLVIDHHIHAIEIIRELHPEQGVAPSTSQKKSYHLNPPLLKGDKKNTNFDLIYRADKSACQIAWDVFNPEEKEPNFITYIGNQDLGLGLGDTAEQFTVGWRKKFNYLTYDAVNILYKPENSWLIDVMISQGEEILTKDNKRYKIISNHAINTTFTHNKNKYSVILCNADKINKGALAMYLCNQDPNIDFAVVWSEKNKSHFASMRTIKDNINLIPIAKEFGGGGHPKACGIAHVNIHDIFNTPMQENKKKERYMYIIKGGLMLILAMAIGAGIYKLR